MKICIKCNELKNLTEFYISKRNKSGYDNSCKVCKQTYIKLNNSKYTKDYFKEISQKYVLKNKDQILKRQKEYYSLNKHYWKDNNDRKEYCKLYSKTNRKILNEYQKFQYNNNPQFKLGVLLRQRFKSAIKGYKIKNIEYLIGCSVEECKRHIESLFHPEMTWENHGLVWEIDHIKPCISFDLTNVEQQSQCFHYTNLQPLFKTTEIAISFGYVNQIGNRNKNKY
jgi:hypothetical protein